MQPTIIQLDLRRSPCFIKLEKKVDIGLKLFSLIWRKKRLSKNSWGIVRIRQKIHKLTECNTWQAPPQNRGTNLVRPDWWAEKGEDADKEEAKEDGEPEEMEWE